MIHINLNMIFYTHVEHSPTKTIYIKYYTKKLKCITNTHTHTLYSIMKHTHIDSQDCVHAHTVTPTPTLRVFSLSLTAYNLQVILTGQCAHAHTHPDIVYIIYIININHNAKNKTKQKPFCCLGQKK